MGEASRVDGCTAKLMGDGGLASFGWPRAHEAEAERAVCAGLSIVARTLLRDAAHEGPLTIWRRKIDNRNADALLRSAPEAVAQVSEQLASQSEGADRPAEVRALLDALA